MMNPFLLLKTTKHSPYSAVINRSFLRRLIDTFLVFAGSSDLFEVKKVGVFDYLSLFLFKGLSRLVSFLVDKASDNAWYILLAMPLVITHIAGLMPRYGLSIAMSILLSPVVLATHLVLYFMVTQKLEEKAMGLTSQWVIGDSTEKVLNTYLAEKKIDMDYIDEVSVKKAALSLEPAKFLQMVTKTTLNQGLITLYFRYDQGLDSWGKWLFNQVLWMVGKYEAQFEMTLDKDNLSQENKIALGAMLKLNYAGILSQIEKEKVIPEDEITALIKAC